MKAIYSERALVAFYLKKAAVALTIIYVLFSLAVFCPTDTAEAETIYALTETEATEILAADGEVYARVNGKKANLYSDGELKEKIFTLPDTYYLSVKEISSDVCRAVYCYEDYDYARGIYGYVKTSDVLFQAEPPRGKSFPNVFPKKEGNGTFYKNAEFTKYYSANETEGLTDPFFYGYYTRGTGERYCFVLCGGKFGYYSAEVFEEIAVPPHSDPMPVEKAVMPYDNDTAGDEKEPFLSSDTNKVILISVLCVIAVSAMYIIFLPKSKNAKRRDPDDEE